MYSIFCVILSNAFCSRWSRFGTPSSTGKLHVIKYYNCKNNYPNIKDRKSSSLFGHPSAGMGDFLIVNLDRHLGRKCCSVFSGFKSMTTAVAYSLTWTFTTYSSLSDNLIVTPSWRRAVHPITNFPDLNVVLVTKKSLDCKLHYTLNHYIKVNL